MDRSSLLTTAAQLLKHDAEQYDADERERSCGSKVERADILFCRDCHSVATQLAALLAPYEQQITDLHDQLAAIANEASDEPKPLIQFFDNPANFAREMAARVVVDRDKFKHANRKLQEQVDALQQQIQEMQKLLQSASGMLKIQAARQALDAVKPT